MPVGFNREFLWEAVRANGGTDLVRANGGTDLVLAYQGPIGRLAINDAAHPETISLLMPVNLDRPIRRTAHRGPSGT